MEMKEFYKAYHLNKYNFAEIAGVGTKTLIKFAEGKEIREDSKRRIELAMQVAEKLHLVKPVYTGRVGDVYMYGIFRKEQHEYFINFKRLIQEETQA